MTDAALALLPRRQRSVHRRKLSVRLLPTAREKSPSPSLGFFAVGGSQRQILFRPAMPLTGTPVFVPLYLDFPTSSAYESFGGDAPRRLIQAGALFTDPAPTRVRWFLEGATFDDGGVANGYVDLDAGSSATLKAAISVGGGNTVDFPALTYALANSNPLDVSAFDHELTL